MNTSNAIISVLCHPHQSPRHVMQRYRAHILGSKRKWGTARGLVHYRDYLRTYLIAKWLCYRYRE